MLQNLFSLPPTLSQEKARAFVGGKKFQACPTLTGKTLDWGIK
jgi:hypothetical protein